MAGLLRKTIKSEVITALGCVQLVWAEWDGPIEIRGTASEHHLQLSLLPQPENGLACYPRIWDPRRFVPVGEIFFYPAGELIHVRSTCRRQHSVACSFAPDAVARLLGQDLRWSDIQLGAGLDIANATVRSLLFRIGQEIRTLGFASDICVELMLGQVLVEVVRHLLEIEQRDAGGGLSPWRIRLIDERLCDGDTQPSLGELAAMCQLSVRHLTRAFRASRGRSIGDYIAEHRAERAKMLLLSSPSRSRSRWRCRR